MRWWCRTTARAWSGDEVREALRKLAADGLPVCVDSRYGLRRFRG